MEDRAEANLLVDNESEHAERLPAQITGKIPEEAVAYCLAVQVHE